MSYRTSEEDEVRVMTVFPCMLPVKTITIELYTSNDVVTCETTLSQNNFSVLYHT